MSDTKKVSGFRRALRHRNYAVFAAGNFFSLSADWSNRIAIGWLTWQFTESPAWLGVMSFSDLAPTVILSPIAGAYADRLHPLKVCMAASALNALAALTLVTLYFTGLLSVWSLFAVVLVNGIGSAFGQPVRFALIPNLLPRADLSPAIALGSMTFNLSRFSGPMIAGFVLQYLSAGWAFAMAAVFQAIFFVVLRTLKVEGTAAPAKTNGSIFRDIGEGVRYTARHPGIGPVIFLLLVSSIGTRPFIDLLPGFAASVFGRGPQGLATMTSTVGLGALVGGTYLAMRHSVVGLTLIAVSGVALVGVALIAFATATNFWLAIACLFVVGAGMSTSATGIMTLIQAAVDGPMRGRVVSLYGVIFRGGPAIGSFMMGWAAQFVGLHIPVATGACICIAMWIWTIPRIRRIGRALEVENSHEHAQSR
ncbi:MAG TPA: MFS transporter [Alphaproteobacteria bacterium]|jgi:MFS family permease|nr:MFS transporter [Alphaproteobacteria bacterium]